MKYIFLLLISLLVVGCDQQPPLPKAKALEIFGRKTHIPIYHAEVPLDWSLTPPSQELNLSDTTVPIFTFHVDDIVITVHNFPSRALQDRIPPQAQIDRWINQIKAQNPLVNPFTNGGFGGLRVEAEGTKQNQEVKLIGYSLQLSQVLYKQLNMPKSVQEARLFSEMRGDYTIKALGPIDQMDKHKGEIDTFAKSFELIEPLKMPE